MLSGDVLPTSGSAKLGGFDILTQQSSVRRLLGYCPQWDALLELLTVKEHLLLYGRVKGVPEGPVLDAAVAGAIRTFDLGAFEGVTAVSLSGGNKRKLSVAIALMGSPPILFLDEPSTGMDPVAKRHLWGTLAGIARAGGCSTILTSHSMEEVEALCGRVGVMVGGRLRCLGSIGHLRAVHGKGWTLECKVRVPGGEEVGAVGREIFGGGGGPLPITLAQFLAATERLGKTGRVKEVHEKGSGWALAAGWGVNLGGERGSSGVNPLAAAANAAPVGVLDWAAGVEGAAGKSQPTTTTTAAPPHPSTPNLPTLPASTVAQWWVEEDKFEALVQGVEGAFSGATLVERQGYKVTFRVPSASQGGRVSELFARAEGLRVGGAADSFTLAQTTLESIFNSFAAQQEEETGVARGVVVAGGGGVGGGRP